MNYQWPKGAKKSLSPQEVLIAAFANLIYGEDQHHIALILGVDNQGRIAEAVGAIRFACENHMPLYEEWKKQKQQAGTAEES